MNVLAASRIGRYPVQRQRQPSKHSSMSCSVGVRIISNECVESHDKTGGTESTLTAIQLCDSLQLAGRID